MAETVLFPAGGATPTAVPAFHPQKRFYAVEHFRLGGRYDLNKPEDWSRGGDGGVTLESLGLPPVQMACITLGRPRRGADGRVDNAILICPYYSGDASNMLDFWAADGARTDFSGGVFIGPGKVFDPDRHYLILADALGLWGASRPAASHPGREDSIALGTAFPQYSMEDIVQLQYRMLRDHLGIDRLRLVTGVSLGASLTYAWGVMHPDFMENLLPVGGTIFQDKGMVRWLFDLMTSAIQSDPVYRMTDGQYYDLPRLNQPILGLMFGWSILKQSAFVDELRCNQSFDDYILEGFDWDKSRRVIDTFGREPGWGQKLFDLSLATDANDMIWRNVCQARFNIEPELSRIRARTEIIHIETDQWIQFHIARRAQAGIAGSRLHSFAHDYGHYAVFQAPGRYETLFRELAG